MYVLTLLRDESRYVLIQYRVVFANTTSHTEGVCASSGKCELYAFEREREGCVATYSAACVAMVRYALASGVTDVAGSGEVHRR